MIRLALIVLFVLVPAWQVIGGLQDVQLSQCSTDSHCMMMHGGDGGPDTGE